MYAGKSTNMQICFVFYVLNLTISISMMTWDFKSEQLFLTSTQVLNYLYYLTWVILDI